MGIREHRGPEVSVLWLGTIVVSEDVTQGATLAGVSHEEVELVSVGHQPSCQSFAIGFGALSEFADDGAALVTVLWEPHIGLLLEGDDRLPDFERPQQARLCEEGKKLCPGPTAFGRAKCLPNQAGMTGWQVASNSHSRTSAKPVPRSLGRRPLIATRVIPWVGCPSRSK